MAEVKIPGSKSVTNRALFLSACASGLSYLRLPLISDDTEAFADGLTALGYQLQWSGDDVALMGSPTGPPATAAEVYCRDAGTAARFLPALAATGHGTFQFDASPQLRRRPVGPMVAALRDLGATVTHSGPDGHLPLTVESGGLAGGQVTMDASVSSQFLTALLMAAPLTRDGLAITVTGMVSAPYVEMTVRMMRQFGARVKRDGNTFTVQPGGYAARSFTVEPDASAASYFFAAAAVTGQTAFVAGLGADSLQGDVAFVRVLKQLGATVQVWPDGLSVTGTGPLHGAEINMRDISDTMPTLAAVAPFADGPVRIVDVANTRVKECDRLDACAENLRRLGIEVATGPDWIEIWPGTPKAAEIECRGDHRIAMSFSITGLRTPGITLDDPDCVKKTFPGFHTALAELRQGWGL
ncbi:MAG TPA: 3-phosphoshikimate 1-carboxyvinyltransferase [Streptosporangiaceae bacterium]|nr:3-phosphoshikimate 1-carboxyvinyltransferase [Streptosporangiaceae bacterium]